MQALIRRRSGSTLFALNTKFLQNMVIIKTNQTPLLLEMELSKESRWKSQLGIKGLIQSTLVISISKGLSEILRDIRTSTYQICRIEEKIIQTTTVRGPDFHFEIRI